MVDTASRPQGIETDTWVPATWETFVALCHRPDFEKARCYYDKGWMRFEMAALGLWHGRDNAVVLKVKRLGVQEYWVVNVAMAEVVAFAVENGGSREIRDSQVLPGLALSVVEEAMQRSQTEDDGALTRWLIQTFQK